MCNFFLGKVEAAAGCRLQLLGENRTVPGCRPLAAGVAAACAPNSQPLVAARVFFKGPPCSAAVQGPVVHPSGMYFCLCKLHAVRWRARRASTHITCRRHHYPLSSTTFNTPSPAIYFYLQASSVTDERRFTNTFQLDPKNTVQAHVCEFYSF